MHAPPAHYKPAAAAQEAAWRRPASSLSRPRSREELPLSSRAPLQSRSTPKLGADFVDEIRLRNFLSRAASVCRSARLCVFIFASGVRGSSSQRRGLGGGLLASSSSFFTSAAMRRARGGRVGSALNCAAQLSFLCRWRRTRMQTRPPEAKFISLLRRRRPARLGLGAKINLLII